MNSDKTNITLRQDKFAALSHQEMDKNFIELKNVIDDVAQLDETVYGAVPYVSGIVIRAPQQLIIQDGIYYQAAASVELPFTTTNWGADEGKFVSVGDAVLRDELSLLSGIKELKPIVGVVQNVKGFYQGSEIGGGQFYYDPNKSKTHHNGGTVIAPEALFLWGGTPDDLDTLCNWTGLGDGCFVRLDSNIYFESFGAGDNVPDSSPAFASALRCGRSVSNQGSSSYTLREKVSVSEDVSHVTFDGKGAKLIWDGENTNANQFDRTNGIINVKGSNIATETINITVSKGDEKFTSHIQFSVVPSWLVAGEWVKINTPYDQSSPTNRYNLFAEVREVVGNTVYFNDSLKYDYDGSATVLHIKPLKGVQILNFNAEDLISSTHMNAVSGIAVINTVDTSIENFNMDGMYNPAIVCYSSARPKVKKGIGSNAKSIAAGRGYYIQFGDCRNIETEDLFSYKTRRTVDFTACGFATVKRCSGIDNSEPDLSLHGQYEHDITYEDCQGSVGVAISGASFGNVADDITLKNVRGKHFFNYEKASNVTLQDCEFEIWSTTCFGFVARNSKATFYARINANSRDRAGFKKSAKIYGGYVKSETFSGANFVVADKGVVEFIGAEVESTRAGEAIVNMDYFKMIGGIFRGGFMSPRFRGEWDFIGTVFDNTCFHLNNNIFGGSVLNMSDCSQINTINTGIIRNNIPANGIRNPVTQVEDLSQRFTLVIKGGNYGVSDSSHRVIDLGQPRRCLNLFVDNVNLLSGELICDARFPESEVGDVSINFGSISSDVTGNVLTPENFKHRNTLIDLNTEFGMPDRSRASSDRRLVTIYRLDHSTASNGFLAYNYPLDDQARGLLIVEKTPDLTMVTQRLCYFYPGLPYHGRVYYRMGREGVGFTSWRQLD